MLENQSFNTRLAVIGAVIGIGCAFLYWIFTARAIWAVAAALLFALARSGKIHDKALSLCCYGAALMMLLLFLLSIVFPDLAHFALTGFERT